MPKSSSKEIIEDSEEDQVRPNRGTKNNTRSSRADIDEEEKKKDDIVFNEGEKDFDGEEDDEKGEEDDEKGEEDDGKGEEEYEIESIVNAQVGVFDGGKVGYLVKWKGYGPEHDSWVAESDAENAKELIEEYWRKKKKTPRDLILQSIKSSRGRPRKSDEKVMSGQKRKKSSSTSTPTRKRGGTKEVEDGDGDGDEDKYVAENGQEDEIEEVERPLKPVKRPKTSLSAKKAYPENGALKVSKQNSLEADDDHPVADYRPADEGLTTKKSWEKIVKTVDTIENFDGELKVFFTLNNGDKVFANSNECSARFPQKLIQFYESNLRWREAD